MIDNVETILEEAHYYATLKYVDTNTFNDKDYRIVQALLECLVHGIKKVKEDKKQESAKEPIKKKIHL